MCERERQTETEKGDSILQGNAGIVDFARTDYRDSYVGSILRGNRLGLHGTISSCVHHLFAEIVERPLLPS